MSCYLNNAATTWPKPECVSESVREFMLKGGANSSRGTSSERDMGTMNLILDCRMRLAELFGGYDDSNPLLVTFTANITEALNFTLRGYLREGMSVITSSMEHNAVMRPLRALENRGVNVEVVRADSHGRLNPSDFENALMNHKYNLAVISHASNVCGTVQPLNEIAELCVKYNVPLVLDTAQTAGVIGINASELKLAALCFTGHKGLMGPQGTGGIIWSPEFASRVEPVITGGTGSYSHLETQPEDMPDKFESGTPNLPGIAGLNSALQWLKDTGIKNIAEKEKLTGEYLLEKLLAVDDLILSGRHDMNNRVSVFAFNVNGIDNGILADELSCSGFETRPGLHCAPSAHKTLNTFPQGALRVSPGYFTSRDDIDSFIEALNTAIGKSK
ncbi:MAG: aminotransferase class V-fold PLP-dependent enzyme [Synergistaceae bacterium]|nr:aminotransferase class V-fold PLP-dependent enzyme [Synergistaceae bacterium]MBQ3449527.1 aminotransferase class V-fold PLP-dependent enzyme [Synergistaceae bacterium]MBQ3693264.1 aminotransferase class V-fold PLP-dependent enzyme [Synergistaceae bacterium]MBQ9629821.1 aminotransferase class V-fold PLP-dependent enzyme [Synergistaceae bacterium]MBR0250224.1 aminotransferase class V-fold PLP-dependent enzyme [Synergistaceae bacterium]